MTTSDEMGTFCHDHIEHPLMWCDEKKRLVERKNAEDSMRMWRRRKAEEIARKEKDKQEYYDMNLKHCPWGRPGGGAPNIDVRRKDITAVGLHSTPSINTIHRLNSLQPSCRYADYFSQRKKCHDPLAPYGHSHGHSHAHSHHHHAGHHRVHHHHGGNSVTVAEGKNGHVDIEVRYKPMMPPLRGKPVLEKIVVTEAERCPLVQGTPMAPKQSSPQKKAALAAKMEKPPSKGPWGKAGPGGKPWRTPKEVGSTFMKSLGWTNKEMLKELDQDNPATPAEKLTFKKVKSNKKPTRCCDVCTCTCAPPPPGPSGPCSSPKCPPKPPKPMPCSPAKAAAVGRSSKFDSIKAKICPRFSRRCPADTNTTDTSARPPPPPAGGGVELVPLLARRRANARPISLSSTDVTKRVVSNERLSTAADPRYLHDLNTQISQKRRTISVAQQIEKDLCNEHFRTFDTFWGRPGHGAPGETTERLKLDNLLYGVQGTLTE